jgi:molybdenum cofactor cytidylyltransferase
VVVVLGAYEDQIRRVLSGLPVESVSNPDWADGMGSSIGVGINHLLALALHLDAALIAVCDQPYFQPETIGALRTAFRGKDAIVAARYARRLGVPVLFGSNYFGALANLRGDVGARQILAENVSQVIGVDLPNLATDLDTWEDYQKLGSVVATDNRHTPA